MKRSPLQRRSGSAPISPISRKTSCRPGRARDRKSTRLNSSHVEISYAVFCLTRRPPSSTLFPYTTLFRSMREWYVQRFLTFRNTAFHDPRSYFHRYSLLSDDEAIATATAIWERTNLANLEENILPTRSRARSEEHTSELQSRRDLVCRLLLDPPPPELDALSLHDALPIYARMVRAALSDLP